MGLRSLIFPAAGHQKKMDTRLVLLGLLSLSSISCSKECRRELLENIDFPGTDITFLYSPDPEHCQMLCTHHPSCLFFTHVRSDWTRDDRHFYCYLKSTPSGEPKSQTPLLGVTSGFSLKPCESNPEPCFPRKYQNVDFLGGDYKLLFTPDYEDCQRVCTQDPLCQFFTFANGDFTPENIRYRCHLKFQWEIPRAPKVERVDGLISGFSSRTQITQQFDTECPKKLFPHTNIPRHNIQLLKAVSVEHCQALCSNNPGCTFFSYFSDDFDCHLRHNTNEMVIASKRGVTSGLPAHFCQLDYNWVKMSYEGIDFPGFDMRFELMDDLATCQKKCAEDPDCQFYTYVTENYHNRKIWHRCYLKHIITMPAIPKINKQASLESGFSLRNCTTTIL